MKNIIRKKISVIMSLFVILCLLIIPSLTFAQKLTHIVKKGDTLWGICEQYYGNPNLWPKLWEMNSFVTNPHLLKAGDVITLFEKEPVKEEKEIEAVKEAVKETVKEEAPSVTPVQEVIVQSTSMGIDMGKLIDVNAVGSFYNEPVPTWGSIFAFNKDKLMFSKGETTYVIFDENKEIKIGDKFFIGESSPLLKHPVTGKNLGYVFNVKGVLTIEEQLGRAQKDDVYYEKKNVFKASINTSYEPISIKDILMPYQPVSNCILPVSVNKEISGSIVAAKHQASLMQTNSIVYIDLGADDDLKKGSVLEVVKSNMVTDPKPDKGFFKSKGKIILPDVVLGRIMILECGPKTSTAVVLEALEDFSPGVSVKGLSWEKIPDFLSKIEACPLK
jgi:hypothetical protein